MNPPTRLFQLLDESLSFPPEYADHLSSHLPMALGALAGLGADDAGLDRFFAAYTVRFSSRSGGGVNGARVGPDWRALRGKEDGFAALTAHFAAAIAAQGWDAVLRDSLPALLTGVGAAAFHGAIRVAHGVEMGHDGELAAGLAYWALRWMPLDPPDAGASDASVADWHGALLASHRTHDGGIRSDKGLIAARMVDMTRTMTYRRFGGGLTGDPIDRLRAVAVLVAGDYAQTGNFTLLHLATGARALAVLAPWLNGIDWSPVWRALTAALLTVDRTPAPSLPDGWDWDEIVRQAIRHPDDHAIKLVHAMVWWHTRSPNPVWRHGARRALTRA